MELVLKEQAPSSTASCFLLKPFYQGRFLLEDFAVIWFCSSTPLFLYVGVFLCIQVLWVGALKADLLHTHSPFILCRILEVARCSQLTDVGFTTLARVSAPSWG